MSIRTGSLDLRTLITAISTTALVHFGLTGKAFGSEAHENKPVKMTAVFSAPDLTPVVMPALYVVGLPTMANYTPRGPGLVHFCAEPGRGVIESGRKDRFGHRLPDQLRCGL